MYEENFFDLSIQDNHNGNKNLLKVQITTHSDGRSVEEAIKNLERSISFYTKPMNATINTHKPEWKDDGYGFVNYYLDAPEGIWASLIKNRSGSYSLHVLVECSGIIFNQEAVKKAEHLLHKALSYIKAIKHPDF